MTPEGKPETLLEAISFFSNSQVAHDFFVGMRWAGGVRCPYCKGESVSFYANRRVYRCAPCKKQFSAKVGTLFEDSPISLEKWLPCVWLIVNAKNGVSSCEIARALGITQKSAWFMLHRVRAALKASSFEKMTGIVESDETFVGPNADFMHKKIKKAKGIGRGFTAKTCVMGLLERASEKKSSRVKAKVVKNTKTQTLKGEIDATVQKGSTLHTDAWRAYQGIGPDYVHKFVDHAVRYVQDNVHTNGLENFWCLLKRTIKGTYVHVNAEHLNAYLDEQAWRYNERKLDDGNRFAVVTKALFGKRLTYKELIARSLEV